MYMLPFVKWAGGKRQLKKRLETEMPSQYHAYLLVGRHCYFIYNLMFLCISMILIRN